MLSKSTKEFTTLAQRAIAEFGLLPSSGFLWAIAGDWIDDYGRNESDQVMANSFRLGISASAEIYGNGNGNGNGNGDGDGYGNGNGNGNGYGNGNGNGNGDGNGYGNGDGNG